MHICFLTRLNPSDPKSWSGIYFHMYRQLSLYHKVEWIGYNQLSRWERSLMVIQKRYNLFRKKKYTFHNKFFCIINARIIRRKLKHAHYDLLFAPAALEYIAYLHTSIPIVYLSDATFQLLIDYYPYYTGLHTWYKKQGNRAEYLAIRKARKIIYSSTWAATSAIDHYGADKSKISVIDFGANLLVEPFNAAISFSCPENGTCNLLFIGVEWVRKGGDIAYNTLLKLQSEHFDCKLIIIGCKPDLKQASEHIEIIPYLDKGNPQDAEKLGDIFLRSHFLLLPTRADCTPVVFSEAAAFGVPVISTDTGGVSSVIHEGVNGFLLPLEADESLYAEKIRSVFNDYERYNQIRLNSLNEFATRLSWEVWVSKFNQLISDI